ncbi:hypothetical protein ASG73_07935 [Janibacter sp. Soil728]|uniref:cell division protein PerM n=1 Tax=Janibacter sp. Soil728 TaxID=1736393 RepID=UPI0006FEB77D|nr:DUF6350 family protein [Janibacter sp. Soil728]KRE37584.1 hypothetical protein ASG73_07935 [Janibacter sp. Soil728]
MEILRSATTVDDGTRRRPELRAAAAGALTATAGWVLPVLLVILGALAVPRASAGFGDALGSGSLLWLVLGGARLHLGAGTLALTPLLGAALLVLLARVGARRGLPEAPDLRVQGSWLAGYAAVGVVASLLGLFSPAGPVLVSLVLPLLVIPALGLAWAHGLPERPADLWSRAPLSLRRGIIPGAKGALLLIAMGAVLVALATLINIGRVGHIHSALEAGFFGGLVLVLLQVALLPNLALWGLSFAAGPGFSTTGGAMTTWSGAEAGLLPMVPVLAAQPQPGGLPWMTHLLVLLPIAAGVWLGRETLTRVPRLAATQTKLAAVAAAVVVAALTIGVIDSLAGGSMGAARLSHLGAPAFVLMLVLAGELALGAFAALARDWWVLRR